MKAVMIAVLIVALTGPVFAEGFFDEIGDVLKPLIPDEVSAAFTLEVQSALSECNGHIRVMGNYDLVHLLGKPLYFDLWNVKPLGAGFSYKLFGTQKRFGVGYDQGTDSFEVYFRQAIVQLEF